MFIITAKRDIQGKIYKVFWNGASFGMDYCKTEFKTHGIASMVVHELQSTVDVIGQNFIWQDGSHFQIEEI